MIHAATRTPAGQNIQDKGLGGGGVAHGRPSLGGAWPTRHDQAQRHPPPFMKGLSVRPQNGLEADPLQSCDGGESGSARPRRGVSGGVGLALEVVMGERVPLGPK